jgi:hypothetical protein
MQNQAMELNSVIYNAANQNFEALATVRAGRSQPRKTIDTFDMLRQLAT